MVKTRLLLQQSFSKMLWELLDRHLRKLCHGGTPLLFTISWKASRNDACGRSSGKLCPRRPSRQGVAGAKQGPSLQWEGKKKRLSPLQGGKLTSECISPSWEKESVREKARDLSRRTSPLATWRADPTGRSPVTPREHAWRARGGSPLRRTCRRHHYRGRHGNDGQDRLVESHRCSMPGGVKDNSVPSPAGLRHRPKSCDIYHACNLATMVSPWV
jgi:hypothetical protein